MTESNLDSSPADYCTAFPESVLGTDISQCCKAHDDAYTLGSSYSRYNADVELFSCIQDAFPPYSITYLAIPFLMYAAVRTFGWWFYKRK